MKLTRRTFMKVAGGVTAAVSIPMRNALAFKSLKPAVEVDNPLDSYPDRNWEDVYRNQYKYDRSFPFVCSPNDTHQCRVRAFVRNGVVIRVEQDYEHQDYGDIEGRKPQRSWNPRMCLKGFTFFRRVYGPHRLRFPLLRKGWKQWADDGFPELDWDAREKYKFTSRGTDELLKMSWDDIIDYVARGMIHIAKEYSGEEGKKKLLERDKYAPETLTHWNGAGTRCFKNRGGMGLLGVIGKYMGMYRFSNTLALLDANVRGVGPDKAMGGRRFSNYTWHGDQAPGHPYVHGLQASDVDFADLRYSKLVIQVGKNLIENKMPEAHWLTEVIERGGKLVVITPEYSPSATKADYWIPCRTGISDTTIFLTMTKIIMDNKWYDTDFVKKFTDFPLLVRTDTLKRLKADEVFADYHAPELDYSIHVQGLKKKQREQLGDFVVYDLKTKDFKAITREDVGKKMIAKGIDPALEGTFKVKVIVHDEENKGGYDSHEPRWEEVEVMTLFDLYKIHLRDFDLKTTADITGAPAHLIERLAKDCATIKPAAIHYGEGINHYFHATLHNRATYLPLMLTGNIGYHGSGSHTWAGNYKAGNFQGSKWSGPGFKGIIAEDPFQMNLDPHADGKDIIAHSYAMDEEVAYWNHGDTPLIINTPKFGRKSFTGETHYNTPTKVLWFNNVNLLNNAKWVYEMFKNVNPRIDLIISSDIMMTSSIQYADVGFPVNSWMEFESYEVTCSCSNPFLQVWKGGIRPLHDTKDDVMVPALVSKRMGEILGDGRFADYWKFALEERPEVYMQRLFDGSVPTRGYNVNDMIAGKYGVPGGALLNFGTYPRTPMYEQVVYDRPFHTDDGRLHSYCDIPEAIEYGENFVCHREAVEATPYMPNVIVSTNPYIRPEDYGIPRDHMGADERHVRNIKMPWSEVKKTKNPLWEKGYRFYCVTPKTRHRVHSQWSTVDWNLIWNNNFGDPYRMDKRSPGAGEHQLHINPAAAKDLAINDGDYIYVDANPVDRPYRGWKPNDPFYKVARLMVRAKYNPAYPYHTTMMKHSTNVATEKSVKAHETRKDGMAMSKDGYLSNFRYGSQQSITRSWLMPMHQTDTLFHKKKVFMGFMHGGEADNHVINTTPKETLVRITKAEDGGLGAKGVWEPARTGFTPANESRFMKLYIGGGTTTVE
ncbi:MAG: molybdopterin-dependent oxidoreductase [Candidatus Scalindua sp.]|jgi:nitrate reductase / nitrite oxidoreductase, alpha subunit|nr:molybdopterin-dependent oxidoreductase [Candidatus Scalindua sp.]MBT6563043.1 molybdopterin-dependent oxidoreductase [Candidatus Scalindua sp.]MBT7210809.1 molybdopterin-dependent oxidoreductase [Candidatus Scalindua sp.]